MSLPKVSSLDPVDEVLFLLRLEACPLAVWLMYFIVTLVKSHRSIIRRKRYFVALGVLDEVR